MDNKIVSKLILIPGNLPDEYVDFFNKFPIYYIARPTLENANGSALNESKFMGTICLKLIQGFIVIVPGAENYLSKKGKLSLHYNTVSRIGKYYSVEFYLLNNLVAGFMQYISQSKIQTIVFEELEPIENFVQSDVPDEIRFTCGLNTTHTQHDNIINGHITRGYGITFNDTVQLMEVDNPIFGKMFKGSVIELELVDEKGNKKYGGSVIWVPELGHTSHITVNTLIKAALSKQIVEKYNEGSYSFGLKEIDNTSKQNTIINISKVAETEVVVNSWYAYVIS